MQTMDLFANEFKSSHAAFGVWPKVISYMVWPDNEHKRISFILHHVRESGSMLARYHSTGLTIGKEFLQMQSELKISDNTTGNMLREALPVVVSGSSFAPNAPQIIGGQIAGQILIEGVRMMYEGHQDISLKQCLEVLSERLTKAPNRAERSKRARPQDLREHWQQYKSVAHLWAAQMIFLKVVGEVDIRRLIIGSEIICLDAARVKHRNSKSSLIKLEKSWRVPKDVIDVIVGT